MMCSPNLARSEPVTAASDGPAAQVSDATAKEDAASSGNDLTRPVNSLELRFQYRPSSAPGSETGKECAIVKGNHPHRFGTGVEGVLLCSNRRRE
jgi:hypothetical protein